MPFSENRSSSRSSFFSISKPANFRQMMTWDQTHHNNKWKWQSKFVKKKKFVIYLHVTWALFSNGFIKWRVFFSLSFPHRTYFAINDKMRKRKKKTNFANFWFHHTRQKYMIQCVSVCFSNTLILFFRAQTISKREARKNKIKYETNVRWRNGEMMWITSHHSTVQQNLINAMQ